MHTALVMLQDASEGGPSARMIVGVLIALWLLGLGALLIHIARFNGPGGDDVALDFEADPDAPASTEPAIDTQPVPDASTSVPDPSNHSSAGATFLATSVVPAASATKPEWDAARQAWVSQHPDFGLLVLNTETNRWRAS